MKTEFVHVDTKAKLEALDKELLDKDLKPKFDLMAFDTETNGLHFFRNVIIGFSISTSAKNGWYIPLLEWHPDPASEKERSIDKVKRQIITDGWFVDAWTGKEYHEKVTPQQYQAPDFIKKYMARWLTSHNGLLMHNAPFDCNMVAYNMGIYLGNHLFCDTRLLKHFIDESTKTGLKDTAVLWQKELGIDMTRAANEEQLEMIESVINNGGKKGHVWRGEPSIVSKYACKDTALTYGLFEVGMQKLESEYDEKHFQLFFEDEIMPLCREVVIPMQFGGVKIDVDYFEKLQKEVKARADKFEDSVIKRLGDKLDDFSVGKSMEEAISKKRLISKIIELEGLEYPTITKYKGKPEEVTTNSISKPAVKVAQKEQPHWLWDYILGEGEIKYSSKRLKKIKDELYAAVEGRRYRFNAYSDAHMRWLMCDKLGVEKKSLPQTDSATPENPIPSMKAEVLEEFFLGKYDFIEEVMLFRKLRDLLSKYINLAVTLHNNGWLHMNMDQAGTTSGRFSCRGGFNLQTLPKVEELGSCSKCDSKKVSLSYQGNILVTMICGDCKHVKKNIICYSVVKQGFVAPEGYKIVNADYSSLEPRCFAFVSGDKGLKDIYHKNLDMYSKVYCDVEDTEGKYSPDPNAPNFLKKINPELRQSVKPVVLGIPYGARGPQVANLMGFKKKYIDRKTKKEKEVLDVERGWAWRENYLNAYPDLRKYMERQELDCVTKGYVENIIGRRRHYRWAPFIQGLLDERGIAMETFLDAKKKDLECMSPSAPLLIELDEEGLKDFAKKFDMFLNQIEEKGGWAYLRSLYKNELNNAKNVPIQGLGGHITNKGMLDTTRFFVQNKIDGYVCLQIHDEITAYVREDQSEFGAGLLKVGMEDNDFAKRIDIPMIADPIICDNLKDSK